MSIARGSLFSKYIAYLVALVTIALVAREGDGLLRDIELDPR